MKIGFLAFYCYLQKCVFLKCELRLCIIIKIIRKFFRKHWVPGELYNALLGGALRWFLITDPRSEGTEMTSRDK